MEQLNQGYGYVLYRTILPRSGSHLSISGTLQDRGRLYLNGVQQSCVLGYDNLNCSINANAGDVFDLLIENKGRPSGEVADFTFALKGLWGNASLNGQILTSWQQFSLPFDNWLFPIINNNLPWTSIPSSHESQPAFYKATFNVNATDGPQHTFLMLPKWGKGFIYINGFNIGRITNLGPQCSYYVPASILVNGANTMIIFESDAPQLQVDEPRELESTVQQLFFNSDGQCVLWP